MSSYLTNAQFFEQCAPVLSSSPAQVVTDAITWASTTADSYLRKRYALPLISFDVDLSQNVFYMAQWKLLSQTGFRPGSGQNELLAKQYDDSIKWLRDVSTGIVQINAVDQSDGEVDEEGSLTASDCQQNFQRAGFTGGRGGRWNSGGFDW